MNNKLNEIISQLKSEFCENFRQDSSTSWRLEIFTKGNRSQVVTLMYKEKCDLGKNTSRFICFSPIGPIYRNFDYVSVLRKNSELDIGTIAIEDLANKDNVKISYLVFRSSHLFSSADYIEIWELIVKTAEYADELENFIFSKDNH